jgi:hypothetical protein
MRILSEIFRWSGAVAIIIAIYYCVRMIVFRLKNKDAMFNKYFFDLAVSVALSVLLTVLWVVLA